MYAKRSKDFLYDLALNDIDHHLRRDHYELSEFNLSYINSNFITPPFIPKNYTSSWAQFSLLASNEFERKRILDEFSLQKIPTAIFYSIPLHLQKVFKNLNYKKNSFPVAEKISNKIFSIPMHPYLDLRDQEKVLSVLSNYRN